MHIYYFVTIVYKNVDYVSLKKERKKSAQKQGQERGNSELAVPDGEHRVLVVLDRLGFLEALEKI